MAISLLQRGRQPGSSGEHGGAGEEPSNLRPELLPLIFTLSEGDLSVDLLRGICLEDDLDLRRPVATAEWFDFVGEVNIGINLHYVVEAGRLPRLVRRRASRSAALTRLVERVDGLVGHVATDPAHRLARRLWKRDSPGGAVPLPPRYEAWRASPQAPTLVFANAAMAGGGSAGEEPIERHPVDDFVSEVNASAMPSPTIFARYLGRVMSTWLDCGPDDADFPALAPAHRDVPHESPVLRVAGRVARTADIRLDHDAIAEAWTADAGNP